MGIRRAPVSPSSSSRAGCNAQRLPSESVGSERHFSSSWTAQRLAPTGPEAATLGGARTKSAVDAEEMPERDETFVATRSSLPNASPHQAAGVFALNQGTDRTGNDAEKMLPGADPVLVVDDGASVRVASRFAASDLDTALVEPVPAARTAAI